jgi:DNA-directed RNA polymerase subunit H
LGKFREGSEKSWMNLFCAESSSYLKDTDKEKSYDLFNHQLVPKHELLSKKETEELMREFHIRPHQLPYVMTSDPTVQALGGKVGDILRITRKSATAGQVVVYRYVVEG